MEYFTFIVGAVVGWWLLRLEQFIITKFYKKEIKNEN
jgi:hypothetical protein